MRKCYMWHTQWYGVSKPIDPAMICLVNIETNRKIRCFNNRIHKIQRIILLSHWNWSMFNKYYPTYFQIDINNVRQFYEHIRYI